MCSVVATHLLARRELRRCPVWSARRALAREKRPSPVNRRPRKKKRKKKGLRNSKLHLYTEGRFVERYWHTAVAVVFYKTKKKTASSQLSWRALSSAELTLLLLCSTGNTRQEHGHANICFLFRRCSEGLKTDKIVLMNKMMCCYQYLYLYHILSTIH